MESKKRHTECQVNDQCFEPCLLCISTSFFQLFSTFFVQKLIEIHNTWSLWLPSSLTHWKAINYWNSICKQFCSNCNHFIGKWVLSPSFPCLFFPNNSKHSPKYLSLCLFFFSALWTFKQVKSCQNSIHINPIPVIMPVTTLFTNHTIVALQL